MVALTEDTVKLAVLAGAFLTAVYVFIVLKFK